MKIQTVQSLYLEEHHHDHHQLFKKIIFITRSHPPANTNVCTLYTISWQPTEKFALICGGSDCRPVCPGPQVCVFHALEDWTGLGQMEDYLSVLEYLLWVFTPLAIVFILPFLIVILLYLSILFLHVYKV